MILVHIARSSLLHHLLSRLICSLKIVHEYRVLFQRDIRPTFRGGDILVSGSYFVWKLKKSSPEKSN